MEVLFHMENLKFNGKQKTYVKALEAAKIEAENKLKAEQLIVEDQKFQIEYLKQQINYLTHKEYGRIHFEVLESSRQDTEINKSYE